MAAAIRKKFTEIVGPPLAEALEAELAAEKEKLIFEAEQYYEQSTKFKEDIQELFINLEEEVLKDSLAKKMAELHKAESEKKSEQAEEFLKQCQEITSRLNNLRKTNKN